MSDSGILPPPPAPQPPPLPAPSREPQWVMWGIGGFIALMIAAGAVAFVIVRLGPSRAVARGTPKRMPAAPAPIATRPPVVPRRAPQPTSAAQSFPLVKLPTERQVDLRLKTFWQTGEAAGVPFRTTRTLKWTRYAEFSVQPVQSDMECSFPQAVILLQNLRAALPEVVLDSFELAQRDVDWTRLSAAHGAMTSLMYISSDSVDPQSPVRLCSNPDVAGTLVQVAKAAGEKFQFTKVTVKVDGAASATATRLVPKVTLEGLARSDVDVAAYLHALSRCTQVRYANLIVSESVQAGSRTVRRFRIELLTNVAQRPDASGAVAAMSLTAADVPDVFRAPAWTRTAGGQPPPASPARPAVNSD